MCKYFKRQDLLKILNTRAKQFETESGKPNKIINTFEDNDDYCLLVNQCRIYQKAKRFIIITEQKLHIIPFNKIIGYEVIDLNEGRKPLYSATTTVTKTDTGDMIKRAIIGGIVSGGVGAVIGGVTAKKKTKISTAEEYANMMSRYCSSLPDMDLIIKFDDLMSPKIKISFDQYKENVEEFADILNVIIRRNAETEETDTSKIENIKSAFWATSKKLGLEPTDEYGKTERERIEEEKKREEKAKKEQIYGLLLLALIVITFICFIFYIN